ncbi:MAG TPA: nucleotidyltransferase family protein [Acidimicrobiia bacterium]|nr:nucleotidyltransferase family protein [Acidimicrobiia bacterium]
MTAGPGLPRIPGQPGAKQARGYAAPRFAFREADRLHPGGERVAVLLLAAGRGSRFGDASPKTLARLAGRPLVAHAVAAASTSGLRPIVVVVGCQAAEVAAAAGALAEIVENPEWETGMATSLRAGLATVLPDPTVTAVTVGLADMPRIGGEAYRRLAAAHREGAQLAVATYDGKRGHPVLIGRPHFDEAMKMTGDEGARSLLARHEVTEVPCDGTGLAIDVDTRADLAALEGEG